MRICPRPGLPLQLGCRSFVSRCNPLASFPRPPTLEAAPAGPRRSTWIRKLRTTTKNGQFTHNKPPPTTIEPSESNFYFHPRLSGFVPKARDDASAWVRLLEPHLPQDQRVNGSKDVEDQGLGPKTVPYEEGKEIASILRHARLLEDLDLLSYLGFTLQRWAAVHTLVTKMLDTVDKLEQGALARRGLPSNLKWHVGDIKEITSDVFAHNSDDPSYISSGFEKIPVPVSMDNFTSEPQDEMSKLYIMGEIWQSLGFIVLEAADRSSQESDVAMSYVYQTIGRLHHSGNVSDVVYKHSNLASDLLLFRPPGMHLLYTHIMNVLTDTAWLVHEAEVLEKAKAAGNKPPYRPFTMGIRHLGHEIWLEFILWSCIENGQIKEGMWILKNMQTRQSVSPWRAVSWNSLLENPDIIEDTDIDTEDFWPHPDIQRTAKESEHKSGAFKGLGKRIISAEVVTALTHHAVRLDKKGVEPGRFIAEGNVEALASINGIAKSTGDEWAKASLPTYLQIAGVIESQRLDTGAEPKSLELLLKALRPAMPPWNDSVPTDYQALSAISRPEIYNTSSMLTGLLERMMRTYSSHRQIESATETFNWLQQVIDSIKMDSIQGFFEKEADIENQTDALELTELPETPVQIDQSSIPSISQGTLADLLDLVTISKAFDFGEWLLFSQDADGPAIPLDSYGDQSLTPSILRFAMATQNQQLGDIAMERLTSPVSRNTFNALANFRIAFHQWDEVEAVLNLLCQHRLKTWGESTLATLAAVIMRLEQKIQVSPEEDAIYSLARAQGLLERFLTGTYNPKKTSHWHLRVHYDRAIYRWHHVLSSIGGTVTQSCRSTRPRYSNKHDRDKLPYIPSVAFHVLLDAVVETRGSYRGMEFWKKWCIDIERPEAALLTEDGFYRLQKSADPTTEHTEPQIDLVWFREKQRKAVIPNLATVRIISRAAVQEYKNLIIDDDDEPLAAEASRKQVTKVLDFCVERYRRLGLDKDQIDIETNNHARRQRKTEAKKRKALGKPLVQKVYDDRM
ncbi:uncharacterized protein TRUGW13939_04397 [Talaromyces rugulosus]|uniref:Uncharacterized protein n=1 Tax=Talaromyces rugulosus TaxID=121627 RepID=A0A7H8QU19_TALRU|nr:uncharacterized protein TRUGW13939_04397 [Talaromyces rugulosus]QKX57286.1 hypothetical protein TRUGW13939_04397 [Talaromyces rugulosus]